MSTISANLNSIYRDSELTFVVYTAIIYDSPTGGLIKGIIGNVNDGELYVLNAPFDSNNPFGNATKIATIPKITSGKKDFTQSIYYSKLENIGKYGLIAKKFDLDCLYMTYDYEPVTSVSLDCTGNIDNGLIISWSTGTQATYSLKAIIGSSVITRSGTTEKTVTIPYNEISSASGNCKIEITCNDEHGNSASASINCELSCELFVNNFRIAENELSLDTNIPLMWEQPALIDRWVINVYKNDKFLKSFEGTKQGFTIAPQFGENGNYKFIITIYKKGLTAQAEAQISLSGFSPTISTATLSSTNVERGTSIISTVTGANITGHKVNILDSNNNLISQDNLPTFSTVNLLPGTYKAQIIAYHTNGYYTNIDTTTINFTVYAYDATITSIWPNTTNELRKSNIQIGFSAKNFISYAISVVQNGVTKYATNGDNSSNVEDIVTKVFTLINSLLNVGNATINVNISNTRNGYTSTDSMSATFNVIDNPNVPKITYEQTYRTPKPTIYVSNSSSYISYKLSIDDIETSEIFGSVDQYYFESALENNKYHTFKVKVKNTYGLWSEWASVTFYVDYAELNAPMLNIYTDLKNGCICVAMESEQQENFISHSVLRLENNTWIEIGKELERICTFIDNSCASGNIYQYKVRANDVYGGYKDSEIVEMVISFNGTFLSVPWTNEKIKLEYYNSEDDINKNIVPDNSDEYVRVCGLELPKLKKGSIKGRSLTLNIAFKVREKFDEFMNFIENDTLLLRDGKGLKMYCHIVPTNYKDYLRYYRCVTIAITEIYYKEGDFIEVPDRAFTWNKEEY